MSNINLVINRDEVLRYLGYKHQVIDTNMINLIDKCREEARTLITPRTIYEYKNIRIIDAKVEVLKTNLYLEGKDIVNHLKNSKVCILMAATIGSNIEKRINMYQKVNLTKALILDACATTAIEEVCDLLEEKIRIEAENNNKSITYRFSPGYGDLTLSIQRKFLDVLDTQRKIGLTCSESDLLFPRKSVTAIIGIIEPDVKIYKKSCQSCNKYNNCSFRKEGKNCGA